MNQNGSSRAEMSGNVPKTSTAAIPAAHTTVREPQKADQATRSATRRPASSSGTAASAAVWAVRSLIAADAANGVAGGGEGDENGERAPRAGERTRPVRSPGTRSA